MNLVVNQHTTRAKYPTKPSTHTHFLTCTKIDTSNPTEHVRSLCNFFVPSPFQIQTHNFKIGFGNASGNKTFPFVFMLNQCKKKERKKTRTHFMHLHFTGVMRKGEQDQWEQYVTYGICGWYGQQKILISNIFIWNSK